ncbi:DUF2997 domain-containing protein [bacterium]|nr:DUF2997 domain-containing protein [bacterium]
MAKKQLKIKILPNGEIQMQTQGIKGKKCLDYISMMKLLADIKIEKQELTDEYYEQEETYYNQDDEAKLYDI